MTLSRDARLMSGITLLIVPTIMYGGWTLLGILTQSSAGYTIGTMRLSEGPVASRACARWRLDHSLCVAADSAGLGAHLDRLSLASSHLCANLGSGVFGSIVWPRVFRLLQYTVIPRCRTDADCSVDDRSGAITRLER